MATTALAVIAPTAAMAQSAGAQQSREFDIPAQSLAQALMIYGRQAGLQVTAEGPLTEGKTSGAVKGNVSAGQALSQLLVGTGLTFRFVGRGGVHIERAPEAADGAVQLGPVRVEGEGSSRAYAGSGAILTSAPSTTEGSNSYATQTVSMAKGETLREIPQSVSVVTQQRIQDQALLTIDDVLRVTPGVQATGSRFGGRGGTFYTRGRAMGSLLVDGSRNRALGNATREEGSSTFGMAMYDHVEVLRGADGLYSGLGDSSGTVNLVRKRPTREFQTNFMVGAGSWSNFQAQADVSVPLTQDGGIRARIVGFYQNKNEFYRPSGSENGLVYGIIEADVGSRGMLAVGGAYTKTDGIPDGEGLPSYVDGGEVKFARSFSPVAPWSTFKRDMKEVFGEFRYDFSDNWSAIAKINYYTSFSDRQIASANGLGILPNDTGIIKVSQNVYKTEAVSYDVNIKGDGHVAGLAYSVLLGVDGTNQKMWGPEVSTTFNGRNYRWEVYSIHDLDWSRYAKPSFSWSYDYGEFVKNRTDSIYGRIKVGLTDNIKIIAGGRLSYYKYIYDYNPYSTYIAYKENAIFTPYGGIVADITQNLTAYASVTEIHKSQASSLQGPPENPSPLTPLKGRNYEAGIKGAFLNGALTASAAVFRLDTTGEAVSDATYPASNYDDGITCCYAARGNVRSQGIDLEVAGNITPTFDVMLGYTYTDTKDRQNGSAATSTQIPEHIAKLWLRYDASQYLKGLKLGGGMNYQSKAYVTGTQRANIYYSQTYNFTISQGGYAVFDAFAGYQVNDNLDLSVNVSNIFDKTYYAYIYNRLDLARYYGAPRSVMFTLRGHF